MSIGTKWKKIGIVIGVAGVMCLIGIGFFGGAESGFMVGKIVGVVAVFIVLARAFARSDD